MSSMISAQGVVLATAMAVSGTVILLALRLQRSFPSTQFAVHEIPPSPPSPILRSCISSDGKKKKKKNKRVHFAEDVMDSCEDGEEFRRSMKSNSRSKLQKNFNGGTKIREIPANRVVLYNGILRDRVAQRLAYSC
ncbi:uncharacterized protein LOC133291128 [Gastrolobium bilobum]|uniref:uncharacterized protein LOC133291128 n=1 Tax=Gastrolobium bilobum TaxID=150636 RepID=UPI002AAFDCD1|nr:uncharacterized protein LOC133291128 [Gastrolobium bilobum]